MFDKKKNKIRKMIQRETHAKENSKVKRNLNAQFFNMDIGMDVPKGSEINIIF